MNMTTLDFLYLALAVGFISLVVFLNMVLYNIWLMVKSMRNSIENVHTVTRGIVNIKDNVKLTVLRGIKAVTSKFHK